MKRIKLVAGIVSVAAIIVVGFGPRNVVRAAGKALDVFVTNTAANPVPIAGSVNVGNLPATQQVSGTVSVSNLPATQAVSGTVDIGNFPDAPAAASKTFSIPVQSLVAGSDYTFLGAFTTASLLTVVSDTPIQVTFNGPAPVLVATSTSITLPLTQRIQVDSVNVACMAASGSCRFRFFVVGD